MRLTACQCRAEHYQRAQRKLWMRLVWSRRLYHCQACDEMLLIPPTEVLFRRAEEKAVHLGNDTPSPGAAWRLTPGSGG
jgi:hypothetical protein